MSYRRVRWQVLLAPALLHIASGCASSGASSSSLPDWATYVGTYEFDATGPGGDLLEGYVVLHSPEEYSVRFTGSVARGLSCTRLRNHHRAAEGRADLAGNRLLIECGDANLSIRRNTGGLEGSVVWTSVVERTRTVCRQYAGRRGCVSWRTETYGAEESNRGTLRLAKVQ
jgi:hypothetical protein